MQVQELIKEKAYRYTIHSRPSRVASQPHKRVQLQETNIANAPRISVHENEYDSNQEGLTIKRSPKSPLCAAPVLSNFPKPQQAAPPCPERGLLWRRGRDVGDVLTSGRADAQVSSGAELGRLQLLSPASFAWAAGFVSALSALRPSPFASSRSPRPVRHGAVGAPGEAPLSLGPAASAARGHHAYPWVAGRGSDRAGSVGRRRPAGRALRCRRPAGRWGRRAWPGRARKCRRPAELVSFGLRLSRWGGVGARCRDGETEVRALRTHG